MIKGLAESLPLARASAVEGAGAALDTLQRGVQWEGGAVDGGSTI